MGEKDCKQIVESCVGAWLADKRALQHHVTTTDEALVERLHRELGTARFEAMIAENHRRMDAEFGVR